MKKKVQCQVGRFIPAAYDEKALAVYIIKMKIHANCEAKRTMHTSSQNRLDEDFFDDITRIF